MKPLRGGLPIVLVVDDEPHNLELVQRTLKDGFELRTAGTADEAMALLGGGISVIVTDQRMPGSSGIELLKFAAARHPDVKRLLLTAYADGESLSSAINDGQIHAYVKKPWQPSRLREVVTQLARLQQLEAENAALLNQLTESRRLLGEQDKLLARTPDDRIHDLVQTNARLRALNDELVRLASRDLTTGLYNHTTFRERLEQEISRAARHGHVGALVLFDLDRFRAFNEARGVEAGNLLLAQVGEALSPSAPSPALRSSDVAARLGGDEFACFLPETDVAGAKIKAERLRQTLLQLPGRLSADFELRVSFGVAHYPIDAQAAQDLFARAEQALSAAKARGGNCIEVFHPGLLSPEQRAARMENAAPAPYWERVDDADALLARDGRLEVVYLDFGDLSVLEREYGPQVTAEIAGRASTALKGQGGPLSVADQVLMGVSDRSALVIYLDRRDREDEQGHVALANRIAGFVRDALSSHLKQLGAVSFRPAAGFATALRNRNVSTERLVERLVREAARDADVVRRRAERDLKIKFVDVLSNERLRAMFQPIVSVPGETISGYEGLIRGPLSSELESPLALLELALSHRLEWEFDQRCIRTILEQATQVPKDVLLFLNILPGTLYDTRFCVEELPQWVARHGLSPSQLVLEINEQLAVSNLHRFARALEPIRKAGFLIAIDDVGSARGNLEQIRSVAPDFIKLDRSIIDGIAAADAQKKIVDSMVYLGRLLRSKVIAEGVESEEDYRQLVERGVDFVQGFFFARPGPAFPELRARVPGAVL